MAMTNYQANAIHAINPNAEFEAIDGDINNINWLNGTTPISVEDINAKANELKTAKANEENQKATDKANGNQKLLDLGLTQAEATALTGYTPPAEV
jgi:hypothetical protein